MKENLQEFRLVGYIARQSLLSHLMPNLVFFLCLQLHAIKKLFLFDESHL